MSKQASLSVAELLGPNGPGMGRALKASREYLRARDISGLLANVGETIDSIPPAAHLGKHFIQASYVKDRGKPPDDLVTGQGVFYITEQRRLFLDGTAGHYQMTWGYNHPELNAIVQRAIEEGIVWDDHNNVPGNAVKRLSARLVEVANGVGAEATPLIDDGDALNTVLLGVCTGSVAASSALKIVLKHHEVARPNAEPVIVAINGNYHGTDFFAQRLRGMWEPYVRRMKVVLVEPNDIEGIRRVFETHGDRTAAFFAEPILMNREAISLDEDFMREARALAYSAWAWYFNAGRKADYDMMSGYIGTQADKTADAVDAFVDLIDHMPVSPERFDGARKALISRYRTQRIGFRDVLNAVRTWKLQGLKPDPRQGNFQAIQAASIDTMLEFHARHVQGRAKLISIVGDRRRIDLEALRRHGKLMEVGLEDLFAF